MEPLSILFTHFGESRIRGSEQVLIDLVDNLDRRRFRPVVWCNAAHLAGLMEERDIPVHRSDFTSFLNYDSPRLSLSRYYSFVSQGLRLARANNIALLHSNGASPHQWLLPVAYRLKLPLLAHLHAHYLRRERFVSLLHQATMIVGVSHGVVREFLTDGIPQDRIKVIYNGVDRSRFPPAHRNELRAQLGIGNSAIVIASVGSLVQRKGMDLLIRALSEIRHPDAHLVIAGDGEERHALEMLAANQRLHSRIHFLGHCTNMAPLYASSDIVALASMSEAFGLVLAEAGSFSLPIVSHNLPGICEVVVDQESGILVPVGDVSALAQALTRLANDPQERTRMGTAGRNRVREKFSTHQMISSFEALYSDMVARAAQHDGNVRINFAPYVSLLHDSHRKDARRIPA